MVNFEKGNFEPKLVEEKEVTSRDCQEALKGTDKKMGDLIRERMGANIAYLDLHVEDQKKFEYPLAKLDAGLQEALNRKAQLEKGVSLAA